jgi:short-subunit dehydrogenase
LTWHHCHHSNFTSLDRAKAAAAISSVMGKINTKYRSIYAAAKHGGGLF